MTDQPVTEAQPGPKYPHVYVQLTGQDGNAFMVMGLVQRALREAGASKEELDAYLAESMSGDYENLLRVAASWVEVG
ncbi:hypothetical protein I5G61_gp89 [Mycobacterium phage Quesadilla]|uniref:Uncharacterized protein n=1 Tax=Mycobacterium phage Quesadilla TaxID=2664226 RepID=A0A5Q2WFP7_9CAUD|nr:hypothetical protein I5G61_gp89 [Mycobacterium phage Quesadilla]QGH75337.1 hypothetical protein SEA_QUESADILLA_89 [Mycobacterium phage Quesadilla]